MTEIALDPSRSRAALLAMMAEVVTAAGSDRVVRTVLDVVEPFEGMHLVTQDIYWGSYDRLAASVALLSDGSRVNSGH